MKHSPKNIIFHELIGLYVKVLRHNDSSLVGLEGIVIDETKNTLKLRIDNKTKTILKKGALLLFKLSDKVEVLVNGEQILGRPEERLKSIKWR